MFKTVSDFFSKERYTAILYLILLFVVPFSWFYGLSDEDRCPKLLVLSLTAIGIGFFEIRKKKQFSLSYQQLLFLGITVLTILLQSLRAMNLSSALLELLSYGMPVVLFFYLRNTVRINRDAFSDLISASLILIFISIFIHYLTLIPYRGYGISYLVRGTFSNKNFAAEVFAIGFFFALAGIKRTDGKYSTVSIVASVLSLVAVVFLKSWSAYLALFAGVLIIFFLSKRFSLFVKIALPVVLLSLSITSFNIMLNQKIPAVITAKSAVDHSIRFIKHGGSDNGITGSIYERLFLWKNSLKLFFKQPLIGVGLSNWQILWPSEGVSGSRYLDSGAMHYDHPHSEALLILSESGIIGLMLFFFFFLLLSYKGFKKTINENSLFTLSIAAIPVVFFVMCQFAFPLHRPYTFMLLLLAFVIIQQDTETIQIRFSRLLNSALIAVSVFSAVFFIYRIKGDYYLNKGLDYQLKNNFPAMNRMIEKADNPFFQLDNMGTPLAWYKGFSFYYSGDALRNSKGNANAALSCYKESESRNPWHIQTLSDIGALMENQGNHAEAINYFNKVLSFVPNYYNAHINLAVVYYNTGELKKALYHVNYSPGIGEPYTKMLEQILIANASLVISNGKSYTRGEEILRQPWILRDYNKTALAHHVEFEKVLRDSLEALN